MNLIDHNSESTYTVCVKNCTCLETKNKDILHTSEKYIFLAHLLILYVQFGGTCTLLTYFHFMKLYTFISEVDIAHFILVLNDSIVLMQLK